MICRSIALLACVFALGIFASAQDEAPVFTQTEDIALDLTEQSFQEYPPEEATENAPPSALDAKLRAVGDIIDGIQPDDSPSEGSPPVIPQTRSFTQAVGQGIAALFIVLALILLLFALARRYGGKVPLLAATRIARPVGRLHLGRGIALHFVQMGGRVLVLGVTNSNISLVAEFDDSVLDQASADAPEPDVQDNGSRASFLEHLRHSANLMDQSPKEKAQQTQSEEATIADFEALRGELQHLRNVLKDDAGNAD